MFAESPFKVVTKFEWKELHGKIVKICVAEANPEVLEFTTQVWAVDLQTFKAYAIHEEDIAKRKPSK